MVSPVFNKDPESAMVHHQTPYQCYGNQLSQQAANPPCNSFGTPMHDSGDPWPWPVGVKEVALEHNALVQRLRENAGVEPKPEAQHFDTEAHRAFMRGLG